jgi:enamine deaminase RidA (YjgF/YER057c/UK114 family)
LTTGISIESRLVRLNIDLPYLSESKGNYTSYNIIGDLLYVCGQLCVGPDGKIPEAYRGKLGSKITEADGYAAARLCMLQVLAHAKLALGSLDRITKCVRLGGFVNAEPDFVAPGAAMNGASDMIVEIMGEPGRHSRTTIGVATLPLGACIEVEALFAFE